MNARRKLLIALGAGALTAPFASFAQQQGKVWRVGFLVGRPRPASGDFDYYGGFLQGMRELGYVEGKNYIVEWRFADNYERLLGLAADLVRLKVDVIAAAGNAPVRVAQQSTTTIPIVMGTVIDPVESGFIASLAHPGGNTTGLSNITGDISPKHLDLLLMMLPKLSHVAVLLNPGNPGHLSIVNNIQIAVQKSGVKLLRVEAQTPDEVEQAFAAMAKARVGAVIVALDAFFIQQQRQIAELTMKYRLPSVASIRTHAEAGALMSYGQDFFDKYRRAATYVDKILKGARPGDIPVEQPTKFELVINGKTAKALGLKIPQSLLISADKVIE